MNIGIGLPNPIPGTPGSMIVEWARRAENRGFSALATIDRIAYPSYESLIVLAAAAGATERIGLMTNVLLGPTRDPVLLAKQAASVDQVSGGRLTLGLGVGGREDDFQASGQEYANRGRRQDQALDLMHRAWRGEPVAGSPKPVTPGPVRDGRVPIMIGGLVDRAVERTVRWGVGWTAGGLPPEPVRQMAERVRAAWKEAGRAGEPRIAALGYYALGSEERATAYLKDYYGFLGEWADKIAQSALRTPQAIRDALKAFEEAGVTDFFFDPAVADLEQVDRLAEIVL